MMNYLDYYLLNIESSHMFGSIFMKVYL